MSEDQYTPDYIRSFIIEHNTHNNEWGFPTGYQAAFTRYLKTLSEFGFLYAQYNQPLLISPVGKATIDNRISLSEAFALQSMRFWRKSPYRRVLNDFNYFAFILEVIRKRENNGKKTSYVQFLASLFSDDGDVDAFILWLDKNLIGSNQDKAYSLIFDLYSEKDSNHARVVKQSSAFQDYGNTVFRVLQLTGFIAVDYSGVMLLSLNKNRISFLDSLLSQHFYVSEAAKEDEKLYFQELGSLSPDIEETIYNHRKQEDYSTRDYNTKIPALLKTYGFDKKSLADYLLEVANNRKDKRAFWYLQAPVKFELLLTLFLYTCYGDRFEYQPNYKCDDAGLPYSHAPGNMGDIELSNDQIYWLVEATLIRNKNQQINSETVNLFRHINSTSKESYLSLVAPIVHEDTSMMLRIGTVISMLEKKRSNLSSIAYDVQSFVEIAGKQLCIDTMKQDTLTRARQLRDYLNSVLK